MKTSLKRLDYHQYDFSRKEWIVTIAEAIAITLFLAWFFYRNLLFAVLLSPLGYVWVRYVKRTKGEKRRDELTGQIK